MKLKTLDEFISEHMKDPEFRREWEALAEEFQKECARIRAEIEAENLKNSNPKNSEKVA
jgi:hypothetical protein